MLKRLIFGVTLASLLPLYFTAGASAYRAPTEQEQAGIAEATSRSPETPEGVTVSRVRVSGSGTWATANLQVHLSGEAGDEVYGLGLYTLDREANKTSWYLVETYSETPCLGPGTAKLKLPRKAGEELGLRRCVSKVFVAPNFGSERLAIRPRNMNISGDGTLSFYDLVWRSWGGGTARAIGRAYDRSCTPDCAEGQVDRTRVKVLLTNPVSCQGRLTYFHLNYIKLGVISNGSRRKGGFSVRPSGVFEGRSC